MLQQQHTASGLDLQAGRTACCIYAAVSAEGRHHQLHVFGVGLTTRAISARAAAGSRYTQREKVSTTVSKQPSAKGSAATSPAATAAHQTARCSLLLARFRMCSCRHAVCKVHFRICLLHLAGLSSSLQRQERSPEQLPAAACRLTGRRLGGCQRSDGCTAGGSNQFQLPPAILIMYVRIASNQMQGYCMMIMLVYSPAASGVRSNAVTRRAPQGRRQKQLLTASAA